MNLYHYCSNAAFVSIISTREIWASEFSLSNDLLEGKWIREIFKEYCKEKGIQNFDQITLLEDLGSVGGLIGGVGFCMSEEGDLLSQWRAYADDGAGISIGFSSEYFEALGNLKMRRNDSFNAVITQVVYNVAKQKEIIAEHGEEIIRLVLEGGLRVPTIAANESEDYRKQRTEKRRRILFRLFLLFFGDFCSLKNPAFAEEKEWRLISHVLRRSGQDPERDLLKMDFRPLRDRIVPFRRIILDEIGVAPIAEVVLGPRNITPDEIVDAILRKYSIRDARVRRSSASYR